MSTQSDVAVLAEKVRVAEEMIKSHQSMAEDLKFMLRIGKHARYAAGAFAAILLAILGYQHWWVIPNEVAKLAATSEMEEAAIKAKAFNRTLPLHAWAKFRGDSVKEGALDFYGSESIQKIIKTGPGAYKIHLKYNLPQERRFVSLACEGIKDTPDRSGYFYVSGHVAPTSEDSLGSQIAIQCHVGEISNIGGDVAMKPVNPCDASVSIALFEVKPKPEDVSN